MKKFKLFLFLFLFFTGVNFLKSQDLPNIVPPSPTAYELGKYGEINVGEITGTIQPSVPLITYGTSSIKIPVSLSYNSNGIKVDQLGSNVGLGWSLNIGGVISRSVRGRPDEKRTQIVPQDFNGNYSSSTAISFFEDISIYGSDKDTSVDVFNYNFLGQTGQFVLDTNKIPINLKPNGIKIEMSIDGFIIIDTKGVSYHFADTEESRSRTQGDGITPWSEQAITAWYLSKIVHPLGDEVYFNYNSHNYFYDSGKIQSLKGAILQTTCEGIINEGYEASQILTVSNEIKFGKSLVEISNNRTSDILSISYKTNHDLLIDNVVDRVKLIDTSNGNTIKNILLNYINTNNRRTFLSSVNYLDPQKKYTFEYISPNSFPKRMSFSQDHWGYYNGKNNIHFFPNPSKINGIEPSMQNVNLGADKEVDENFAKIGLLKKIIYPTKGSTNFEYESNSYDADVEVPPNKLFMNLNATSTSSDYQGKTETKLLNNVKIDQEVLLTKSVQFNSSDNNCFEIPHHNVAFITVNNLTTSQSNILFQKINSGNHGLGNSLSIRPNNTYPNLYLNLKANCDYQITLSTSASCVSSLLSFSYYAGNITVIRQNKLLGGLRIKKITSISDSQNVNERRFYYGKKESLETSTGQKGAFPSYVSFSKVRQMCQVGPNQPACEYRDFKYTLLNSSSIRNLYESASVFSTNYRYVTISYGGDNFENGGEQKEFIIQNDGGGKLVYGDFIANNPRDNSGYLHGLLNKVYIFKMQNSSIIPVKTIENQYKRDARKNEQVFGYTVNKNFIITCPNSSPDFRNLENLDVMENKFRVNWVYLSSSEEKKFDINGNNPILKKTNYFYDNPSHFQLTRTEVEDSEGKTLKEVIKYAHDVNDIILQNHNKISNPIEITTYNGTVKLSEQKTIYDTFGSNNYLPQKIQTSKGNQSLEDRIVYHQYDDRGNPLEVSKKDGSKIYYVWGYNQTQPIAKIEGYTDIALSNAQGHIDSSVLASNNDSTRCLSSGVCNEQTLRDELSLLRAALPDAQVTTFTYDPLIGVTSITDPRGQTVYYEYDSFNRLEFVKDNTGNILSKTEYNYKN